MIVWAAFFASLVAASDPPLAGFRPSAWFGEQTREQCWPDGVRALVVGPPQFNAAKPTRLVVFATPNGNTIEQTLGCAKAEGLDWHFDIQHVAAQMRSFRAAHKEENVVFACLEAEGLSWPAWKRKSSNGPKRILAVVDELRQGLSATDVRMSLAAHSGGGSFLFGFLDGYDEIPSFVEQIVFLDANYSYSDSDRHGDKLLAWLKSGPLRSLVVIAYDDRNVTLNGNRVVGPEGGTFRATERMYRRFAKDLRFVESTIGDVRTRTALDGRLKLIVHANPQNSILHTALVGEMNGLLHALESAISFGGPRRYVQWIQSASGIPPRQANASGGKTWLESVNDLSSAEREEAIVREIAGGNIPLFLRTFHPITVTAKDAAGKEHRATFEVMPDYLAVGSDDDFVRIPMGPGTAARIADAFGCALPTRKIVDEVYRAATVKLAPIPLTKDREAASTFLQHHLLIEEQRKASALGALVAGIKKDVVVTNRLAEKPNRVAIYGWHKIDGVPIQPLTIVHVDRYVDYSHGVRLMKRSIVVDGKPVDVRQVLRSPTLHSLLSDEGPILRPTY